MLKLVCTPINKAIFESVREIARRYNSREAKRRILSACVKLFIEQGYKETTMNDILSSADVSCGTFQNIFKTKSGVLFELMRFMFDAQFSQASSIAEKEKPYLVYAAETAVQIAIVEQNENLRQIYTVAYNTPSTVEYIYQQTSTKLFELFSFYRPELSESDFYELEIGTAGIMRGYMMRPCDKYFTLEKKLSRFLEMSLCAYGVPEKERREAIDFVLSKGIEKIADGVLQKLFAFLEMEFDFSLSK